MRSSFTPTSEVFVPTMWAAAESPAAMRAGLMSLVVAAKIARVDAWSVLRANTPFLIATVAVLALVIVFPPLATWLPSVLGGP